MTDPDSVAIDRCVDEGAAPGARLRRRLARDPGLNRDLRRLRRLDRQLREALPSLRASATASLEARVLGALDRGEPARRARPFLRRRAARPLYAAAAVLAIALGLWLGGGGEATPAAPLNGPADVADLDALPAPGVAFARVALPAPEEPLLAEADNLARDTRRLARSLWGHLPLSSWLTRGDDGR